MRKSIKGNLYSVFIFAAIGFVIFLVLNVRYPTTLCFDMEAKEGVMDLTHWSMNDKNVVMSGEWEFFWNKFVGYDEINKTSADLYVLVPNTWNKYKLNGESLSGEGYATYRLHVKTNLPKGEILALRTETISSAFALYINDKEILSSGKISTGRTDEIGQYRPSATCFSIPSSEFDIIVQVSNFHYSMGGFWKKITMGSPKRILFLHDGKRGRQNFLTGTLAIIFILYLVMFYLNKKQKYTLCFAIMCLAIFILYDIMNEYMILGIFSKISFTGTMFIYHMATYWFILSFILYQSSLYYSNIAKTLLKIYLAIVIFIQLFILITPPWFYSRFLDISNLLDLIGLIFAIIIVYNDKENWKTDGWLNIISIFLLLFAYFYEISYLNYNYEMRKNEGEILFAGIMLFFVIQIIIQANRINSYRKRQIAAELAFLQSQIKPHFIFNALNTIISISRYDAKKSRNLLIEFSNYLRRSFDLKTLSQFTSLEKEIELVTAFIKIEEARFEERLEISLKTPENLEVNVPILMLQPIIENAIKHGILPKPLGGKVDVSIEECGNMLLFKVKDDGVGMDSIKLKEIFKLKKGKGVAISNINSRLLELFGEGLTINSSLKVGTEVSWRIPINSRGNKIL